MRPTKEGKRFLLATLLIAVAAANTGNNLIYLILAMMLSILVISIIVLKINLRGLVLSFSVKYPVFANSGTIMKVSLFSRKKMIPSFSVHVNLPEGIAGQCIIPHIPSASLVSQDVNGIFRKRGIYRYGDFSISSSFPFILFTKKVKARVEGEIIVYPEIKDIDELIPEITGSGYDRYVTRHGAGDEFMMIREFRYGDSMRRIQWKASAKTGKLMVKDMGMDEPRLLTVILDNIKSPQPPFTKGGQGGITSFEKAVSFAASVAYKFIRIGFFVRLLTCKKLIPFGSGQEQLFKILDALALIDEEDTWECPMMHEMQGAGVLILKSEDSSLKKAASMCSMVINASDL
ncbi:MAG: DUF58 domain-containing protein [Thermodesulfovibrionales bacterium]|nr:DUF58 domain-containing protein [Thermodesulfovibrionales bacterium]